MKRTLSTVVYSTALLALTSAASLADATNWLLYIQAGNQSTNGGVQSGSQQLVVGNRANGSEGVDGNDSNWTKPTYNNTAAAFVYDTQDPLKPYWVYDIKSPWNIWNRENRYWDIYIYTGTAYSSSAITVNWWGLSGNVIPKFNGIVPPMGIEIMDDPTGTYERYRTFDFNLHGDMPVGSAANPVGGLTFYDTQGILKYDAVAKYDPQLLVPGQCIRLRVTPLMPEPGSFVGLGTGLVGFAGFALRRRKSSKLS